MLVFALFSKFGNHFELFDKHNIHALLVEK